MKKCLLLWLAFVLAASNVRAQDAVDSMRVFYRRGFHNVDPSFRDNRARLDRFLNSVDRALKENRVGKIVIRSYASPDGTAKANERLSERRAEELRTLRDKGLTMVYMGLESGCDDVLKRMRKGHMSAEIVEMGQKVRRCGMALSVTAITGLGGPELLERHAIETAEAFNAMNPEYIGMLTLMVEPETPLYDWVRDGSFQLLTQPQVLEETRLLMEHLDSPGSVFRMNHASNYLVLKGTLNQDKEAMLRTIDAAEHDLSRLRPEEWRGL